MKTAELLACPICGKPPMCQTAERASNGELYQLAGVWCKPCRIDAYGSTDEDATRKWNDRAGRKPEAVQNSEAKGQFAPCPGSEAANNDPLRQKVIRLVLQISDTPTNRLTMLKAEGAIKALNAGIEGHGVLKREEIMIASLEVPAPRLNEKGQR